MDIPLVIYLDTHTQMEAATVLGVTQSAIWQMLRARREVFIVLNDSGQAIYGYEKRYMKKKVKVRTRKRSGQVEIMQPS